MPLLPKARHERFVHNIVKGMLTGPAYTKAGFKATGNTAQVNGGILFKKPKIQERYRELMAPAVKAAELSVERVLQEMTRLAFYDITAVLQSKKGKITLRDPASLPEDLRRAIVGIKPVLVGDKTLYECKFADKQKSLDSLARHLQMFKDTIIVENVFRIVKEMDDDELNRRLGELERAFGQATTLDPASGEGSSSVN